MLYRPVMLERDKRRCRPLMTFGPIINLGDGREPTFEGLTSVRGVPALGKRRQGRPIPLAEHFPFFSFVVRDEERNSYIQQFVSRTPRRETRGAQSVSLGRASKGLVGKR